MAEKVTTMDLKVNLQCPHCRKKVKKILCKFPQIRDQKYVEKANTVTVTVACCSPEKIRDKLCLKGAKVIESIKIKENPVPKPEVPETPVRTWCCVCYEIYGGGPCCHGYGVPPPPPPCCCGCGGYGYGYGYGGVTGWDYYFTEEKLTCSIV